MSFLLKTLGKKTLAVICTVCLLLSVMSVCFGVFATDTVYTIKANNPAIPVPSGTQVDVSNINFQFDDGGEALGKDITWTTQSTDVITDDAKSTIAFFGDGIAKVTASYKDGTDDDKVFYVVSPNADNTKTLFEYDFGTDNIYNVGADIDNNYNGPMVPAGTTYFFDKENVWKIYNTDTNDGQIDFYYSYGTSIINPQGKTFNGEKSFFFLNPETEAAQMIADFSDYTIDFSYKGWNGGRSQYATLLARYEMLGAMPDMAQDKYLAVGQSYSSGYGITVTATGNTAFTTTETTTAGDQVMSMRVKYDGEDITVWSKTGKSSAATPVSDYTQVYKMSEDTSSNTTAAKATSTLSGMVGFIGEADQYVFPWYIAVNIEIDSELINAIKATAKPVSIIYEDKPVIPAISGKGIDLSEIIINLADGTNLSAADFTWSQVENATGAIVNDANKTILYTGEDPVPVKATRAASDTEVIFYIVPTDAQTKEAVLYSHTFTEADLIVDEVTGANIFNPDSEWDYWTNTTPDSLRLNFNTYYGIDVLGYNDEGGNQAIFYIKPESETGKFLKKFPDITVETVSRAFGNPNFQVGTFFRLDLGDDGAFTAPADESFVAVTYTTRELNPSGFSSTIRIFNGPTTNDTYRLNPDDNGYTDTNGNRFQVVPRAGVSHQENPQFEELVNRTTMEGTTTTVKLKLVNIATGEVTSEINPMVFSGSRYDSLANRTGTIGIGSMEEINNFAPKSFKALIVLSDAELAGMKDVSVGGYLFDLTKVEKPAADATAFVYNGLDQTYTIAENANYTVTGNVHKDAGKYAVTVALTDKVHSNWADDTTADLTYEFEIARKPITIKADAKSVEMGKEEPGLTFVAEGKIDGDPLVGELTREEGTTVGTYAILQGTITNENNPNYDITYVGADFKITKTNQAALVITGAPAGDIAYGDSFTLTATGGSIAGDISWAITEGADFATVDNAGKVTVTGVGAVKVTATKAGDNNYEPVTADFTFTSIKATPVIGTVVASGTIKDTTNPADVVLTKTEGPEGKLVITDAAMSKTQTTYNWKFIPTDSANYAEITGTVEIDVLETTPPVINISALGNNWTSTPDSITFDILATDGIEFIVDADDAASGIKDIYYCTSKGVISAEDLETVTWNDYNGTFKIISEGKYVVYAKAVDNDGNVAIISSNGVVIDATAPEIAGAKNETIYFGDTEITVTDALSGVKEVTLDGEAVTLTDGKFTVAADSDEHTVKAVDKAGNEVTITFIVNKLLVVTFMDGDTVFATLNVKPGEQITMPAVPTKAGFTAKWEKTVESVTEDTVIKAVYTKNDPGEIDVVIPETNVGGATLTDSKEDIIAKVPLTDAEKLSIEQGDDMDIHLEVKDITNEVPAKDKELITGKLDGNTVGMYLDIAMVKKIGNNEAVRIATLKGKVQSIFKLPDSLINTDAKIVRTYSIIHVHDGIVEIITPKFDAANKTLSFETDKFSTYAVVYKDAPVETENKTETPKTEDTTNLWIWAVMLVLCAAAMTSVVCFKKAKQN